MANSDFFFFLFFFLGQGLCYKLLQNQVVLVRGTPQTGNLKCCKMSLFPTCSEKGSACRPLLPLQAVYFNISKPLQREQSVTLHFSLPVFQSPFYIRHRGCLWLGCCWQGSISSAIAAATAAEGKLSALVTFTEKYHLCLSRRKSVVRMGCAPRQALTLGVRIACGCQMRQPGNLRGGDTCTKEGNL